MPGRRPTKIKSGFLVINLEIIVLKSFSSGFTDSEAISLLEKSGLLESVL